MESASAALKTLLFMECLFAVSAQNRPPAIIKGADKKIFISYDDRIMSELICKSSGTPTPSITWYRNSQPVALTAQNFVSTDGSLKLDSPEEGYYQCRASNAFGSAWSNVTWLRKLTMGISEMPLVTRHASVGDTLSLPCTKGQNQRIVPAARYKWQTVSDIDSQDARDIILDKRIQMDVNGTLVFAYVLHEDQQNGRLYRCLLTNTESNIVETSVAFTKLQVKNKVQPTQLTNLFSYSSPSIALEREKVRLGCFFGGAKEIFVRWRKPDGSAIGPFENRYQMTTSELLISNVQKADEGVYTCIGTGSDLPSAKATINLQVESAPYFVSAYDSPHDVNVTDGEDVVINCNSYASPEASVSWFLNGEPVNKDSLWPKFNLSPDKKTLTISKVCKSCSEGTFGNSDLMVIQCNASNVHGYIYGNGYINVLDRTEITKAPANMTFDRQHSVNFTCEAASDVATEVKYFWTHKGEKVYDGMVNTSLPGILVIDGRSGKRFLGTWTCTATNGLSSDSASADLFPEEIGTDNITERNGLCSDCEVWLPRCCDIWIPFVATLLFLFVVVVLLIACCYLKRKHGRSYLVDEEERKFGIDPVEELSKIEFHDFQRPSDVTVNIVSVKDPLQRVRCGPGGSINSSIGQLASDDDSSLDRYGYGSRNKSIEDRSLIGR